MYARIEMLQIPARLEHGHNSYGETSRECAKRSSVADELRVWQRKQAKKQKTRRAGGVARECPLSDCARSRDAAKCKCVIPVNSGNKSALAIALER